MTSLVTEETEEDVSAGTAPPSPRSGRDRRIPARVGTAAITLAPVIGVAAALLLWWFVTEVLAATGSMLHDFAPAPTWDALVALLRNGSVFDDATSSLWRLTAGLALAAVAGILSGAAIGSRRIVERGTRPVLMFLRMISPLSWAPVAISLFGIGDSPVIALVAATAVWPILMSTADGVRRIDPDHLRVARGLGATWWEVVRSVTWPSAQPYLLSGIRMAIGISWVVLVPAEMLGVTSGLGYAILNAKDQLAYSDITALILIIGLIGYAIDAQARWLLQPRRERKAAAR
ncbi:ABC transporter permease [Streptomyces sp. P3]|uniref:ABC transporter permease n=1 Tax=Streptomyces sp. P3 TaxID=2135430 RepID=UPI000D19B2E5|nr:ABC transporter permease [Streptomyces sp. P3]AVV45210.1 ABC transporter permease [Streptomyces sp. P3]